MRLGAVDEIENRTARNESRFGLRRLYMMIHLNEHLARGYWNWFINNYNFFHKRYEEVL